MLIEYLAGFRTDNLCVHVERLVGELSDAESLQVNGIHLHTVCRATVVHHVIAGIDSVAAPENHLVANERVVVEVKTGVASGPSGQFYHPVARILVNPLVGHGLSARLQCRYGL